MLSFLNEKIFDAEWENVCAQYVVLFLILRYIDKLTVNDFFWFAL